MTALMSLLTYNNNAEINSSQLFNSSVILIIVVAAI